MKGKDRRNDEGGAESPGVKDLLSFRCVNRVLDPENIRDEFALMLSVLSRKPVAADFRRVGMGSGSHLLKLTTPRTDLDQCALRFRPFGSNVPPVFAPSLNAPDIPFAKIVYRPLQIAGHEPRHLVDHIRFPDHLSDTVTGAFAEVFGEDCLDALSGALLGEGQRIVSLPATGEFPVIFLPRPGGGDIQATPVSPVSVFMGFKDMSSAWFRKQVKDEPPVPRGRWAKQSVSAQPQNISGAIGGPRQMFLAVMPRVLRDYRAAVMRYALGGSFPAWRDEDVEASVLHYATRLDMPYTNSNIRNGTDWYADQMIGAALDFSAEVIRDARDYLDGEGMIERSLPEAPRPSAIIMRRRWKKDDEQRAISAITSAHFRDREQRALERMES